MVPDSMDRFSKIETLHELLGDGQAVLDRYRKAIVEYLGALLGDEALVKSALLLILAPIQDGTLVKNWERKGRFRRYLKMKVRYAALEAARKKGRTLQKESVEVPLEDLSQVADRSQPTSASSVWLKLYREALLNEALERMAKNPKHKHHYELLQQLRLSASKEPEALSAAERMRKIRALAAIRNYIVEILRDHLENPDDEAELADEMRMLGLSGLAGHAQEEESDGPN